MSPHETFELARRAFDAGDWATAQGHSEETRDAMLKCDYVVHRSSAAAPRHSIVVVSYRHSTDFVDLLKALQTYTARPDYELVLVNNGNAELAHLVDTLSLDCTLLDLGFNYGCAGARNIGSIHARGETVIFVDDDGMLHNEAIEALVDCCMDFGAVAVRGKVVPRTDPARTASHYDLGSRIMPALPNAEGISIWRRLHFLNFGGFDPLLYGHEGILLASRMFRFHGPRHFLYTPKAVLLHDFVRDNSASKEKAIRYKRLRDYLDYCGVPWRILTRTFREHQTQPELVASFVSMSSRFPAVRRPNMAAAPPVSILTTARNGSAFVDDFSSSLRYQTHQNFEIVFVDDGSTDGTAESMARQWGNDPRFRSLASKVAGRGGALQTALDAATHDICAIADIDDVSVPQRLAWTADYFLSQPTSSCCSFYCFNEHSPARLAKPFNADLMSIKARSLIGMPAAFPSFAFRKQDFAEPFDTTLEAGIDCEWIFRNLAKASKDGHFIPLPAVFYRIHDGQITTTKRASQREQVIRSLLALHGRLLAKSGIEGNRLAIELLSRWTPVESADDRERVTQYTCNLLTVIDAYAGCPPDQARAHLLKALSEILEPPRPLRRQRREIRYFLTKAYLSRKRKKIEIRLGLFRDRLVGKMKAAG